PWSLWQRSGSDARSARHVGDGQLGIAARGRFELDQDLAEGLITRVDRRLGRTGRDEENAAGLDGDLDAPGAFDVGVDARALEDAEQVGKIVAVAVGALARREVHLPHAHELVLEQ